MSIQASQLRPGMVIDKDGFLWQCLESVHKTPGNLRAFIQAKMRNLKNGTQKEFRFSSTEGLEKVDLRERPMQFLYNDDDGYHFMDSTNYEQIQISKELLGQNVFYLIPESLVDVTFHDTTPIGVALPQTINLTVVEAEPNMKSATATSPIISRCPSTLTSLPTTRSGATAIKPAFNIVRPSCRSLSVAKS